jgi:hypothetical protein
LPMTSRWCRVIAPTGRCGDPDPFAVGGPGDAGTMTGDSSGLDSIDREQ